MVLMMLWGRLSMMPVVFVRLQLPIAALNRLRIRLQAIVSVRWDRAYCMKRVVIVLPGLHLRLFEAATFSLLFPITGKEWLYGLPEVSEISYEPQKIYPPPIPMEWRRISCWILNIYQRLI